MNRDRVIDEIESAGEPWDFVIIGGGATGLGAAVDAASRGYRALLVEQHDFAKGTSSRSTKLIHGGVRYLRQGNVSLVLEALKERGLLYRNAPHLVHNLAFVIPVYSWWEGPFYGIGMKVYDRLAGSLGLRPSEVLTRDETVARIPTVETEGLQRGVVYYDGQFDDARLAINLAQTVDDLGGRCANYVRAVRLLKHQELIRGVVLRDEETGREHEVAARAVINATGVFADELRRLDEPSAVPMIVPSRGAHVVLPKAFLPGASAIMVPRTADGRVLFAVPWHDRVVVGTTDVAVDGATLEPLPSGEEVEFLLTHAARYLQRDPAPSDVLSVFAGLRPLVRAEGIGETAALSRDHAIFVSDSGLITVAGGKWTTYRKMAQDVIDQAAVVAGVEPRVCKTERLPIHGAGSPLEDGAGLGAYGLDASGIRELVEQDPVLGGELAPGLSANRAQVIWAVREEMARTVEDVLARRTRELLLNARASIAAAPLVAAILARELGRDAAWQAEQAASYAELAAGYLLEFGAV